MLERLQSALKTVKDSKRNYSCTSYLFSVSVCLHVKFTVNLLSFQKQFSAWSKAAVIILSAGLVLVLDSL